MAQLGRVAMTFAIVDYTITSCTRRANAHDSFLRASTLDVEAERRAHGTPSGRAEHGSKACRAGACQASR